MVITFLVGGAVAAGTYLFARKKRASTGQSVAAAAVTGVGSGVATAIVATFFWPIVVLGGAAAGGYYYARHKSMKALPAGRDG